MAHQWAARYAARNRTSIQAGRIAFKESLVDLVAQNKITYPQAMSIVNHEIEARDGSMKTMTSWNEWESLGEDLAEASVKGSAARETEKKNNIAADLQAIKSLKNQKNIRELLPLVRKMGFTLMNISFTKKIFYYSEEKILVCLRI